MNPSRHRTLVRFAIPIVAFLALVAASCPPDRAAYNTIDSCVTAVQSAVSAFKVAKAQGLIVDTDGAKEAAVRSAYTKFQAAASAAADLAQAATTPDQKNNALAIAQAALNNTLPIINAFLPAGTPK